MFKLSNVWWTLGIKEMRFESHNSIRRNKNVLCYFLCAELGWDRILFFEVPQSVAHFLKGGLQKKKAELNNRKPIHYL